ncbi:MAG TPA: aminodeoxychorismate lyase [Rhodanobacteraceae bacterium]|nr:aminodeoxychorismate lyase [Rhodanobacteraceae bacterium]
MTSRVLVNGRVDAAVSPLDRGLLYGDGLFETIRFTRGTAPLWQQHMQRLAGGCARLALPSPEPAVLASEARQVLEGDGDAVVRITLTRGTGQRGYAPPAQTDATRIVSAHPLPMISADWYRDGIRVRSCTLRLASQPRLAGIKHLNRLEQVLARAEWADPDVVEGLLFDQDDQLVSATAANVFGVLDGALLTPALDGSGVAGVLRAALLDFFPQCRVEAISKETSMRFDEMFLCSSVRGVLPVREVDGRALPVGHWARAAQAQWRALGFPGGEA